MAVDDSTKHEFGVYHFAEGFFFPGVIVGSIFIAGSPAREALPALGVVSVLGSVAAHVLRKASRETFSANEGEFLSGFGTAVAVGLTAYGLEKPLAFIPALVIAAGAGYLAWRATRQK